MLLLPQSGHTIEASHIEKPTFTFRVKWKQNVRHTAIEGVMWQSCERWAYVKATTPGGALMVAKYHYSNGYDHQLMLTSDVVS